METLDRIESLIRARGWSKSEFFRRMNLPNNTMSRWRRGLNRSWEGHLPRIAEVLGTTEAYLLGRTDDPAAQTPPAAPVPPAAQTPPAAPVPPELLLLARQLDGLSAERRRYVLGLLSRTADDVMAQLRAEQDGRLPPEASEPQGGKP